MVQSLRLLITISEQGARLDQALLPALRERRPLLSRSFLKDLFDRGSVRLDGRTLEPSTVLPVGEHEIEIIGLVAHSGGLSPWKNAPGFSVIYEDESLLVISKPSGTPSVPLTPEETETAVGFSISHFPPLKELEGKTLEPGLLHRLDTGTSGLLVFAKTLQEFARLRELWRTRKVRKTYRALVQMHAPLDHLPLTIDTPLGHDAKSAKRMVPAHKKIRGKPLPAVTHILRESRHADFSDLEIEIETGVMHQIRCHLASNGAPILGDEIYNKESSLSSPIGSRLCLHAWKLELELSSGIQLCLESKLPEGWPKL